MGLNNKCPFFPNDYNPCDTKDCFLKRNGGCAIILAATIAEENKRKIEKIDEKMDSIDYKVRIINDNIGIIDGKLHR